MLASRTRLLRKTCTPASGIRRFCEQALTPYELGLNFEERPSEGDPYRSARWEEVIPPAMSAKQRHGKWDEFVEERCRSVNLRQKFPSHFAAELELHNVLHGPEVSKHLNELDAFGTSLADHRCFFDVVHILLERLDWRIDYLIFKACHDIDINPIMLHSVFLRGGSQNYLPPSYAQLVRAYPSATRLTHPDRGSSIARDGGRLIINKRIVEIRDAGELHDPSKPQEPEYARVSELPNPDPQMEEFVRDLVAAAEDGILGVNRKEVLIELRMVVDEWLDYLWLCCPGCRLSALENVMYKDSPTNDLYPWRKDGIYKSAQRDLQDAKDILSGAAKVAASGGLAKWRLMELYNFELPHANRLIKGAEEAWLQVIQASR